MLQLKLAKPKLGSDISFTPDWDFSARPLHCKNLIYRKILYHGKAKRVRMCMCLYMFLCHCGVNACMHILLHEKFVLYVLYVFWLVCCKASLYVL